MRQAEGRMPPFRVGHQTAPLMPQLSSCALEIIQKLREALGIRWEQVAAAIFTLRLQTHQHPQASSLTPRLLLLLLSLAVFQLC